MLLTIGAIVVSPSFYYLFKHQKDSELTKIYNNNGFLLLEFLADAKIEKDEVHGGYSNNIYYRARKKYLDNDPMLINAILSFFPFFRHASLLLVFTESNLYKMTTAFNEKLKCEHCDIVHAFWNYNCVDIDSAKCPTCKKRTSYIVVNGNDSEFPFFSKKTKKEVHNFLKYVKKHNIRFNNPNAKKQISKMTEHNEENGFADFSRGPKVFEMYEVFNLSN